MFEQQYAIYGCGGFGREVLPLVRHLTGLNDDFNKKSSIIFVSDVEEEISTEINEVQVISFNELINRYNTCQVIVAIGDARHRRKMVLKCESAGLVPSSIFASTMRQLSNVTVGPGAIFCDFTMATSNIKIGSHFHANIYSYIAHDCIIGDFVTLAPRVCINGNVIVEDDVYIGTGAILKQGTKEKPLVIGRGALIGMGAVVTKDVPPGVVVIGNPARVTAVRSDYEELPNKNGSICLFT